MLKTEVGGLSGLDLGSGLFGNRSKWRAFWADLEINGRVVISVLRPRRTF